MKITETWMGMLGVATLVVGSLAACGGDDEGSGGSSTGSGTGTGTETGTATGTSTGTGTGTNTGAGTGSPSGMPDLVHGCSLAMAEDMTGQASIDVEWNFGHKRCILVDAGTIVNFNGNFVAHPLAGGESPTDAMDFISMSDQSGMTAAITFANAGEFPYFCLIHTTTMQGVIYVQ
ncbi:MAG: hypothetical protein KC731_24035 [Myxococcales bacterium]|nr:hypothetical protein [Myxococcales bacterium]